jgi:hypothetical protein
MYFSIHNRRLLRGMMVGAVALAGASACSRSDRASSGRDTTQTAAVAPADTQANTSTQPTTAARPTTGAQPASGDTAARDSAATTPSEDNGKASRTARTAPAKTGDQGVAGYKAMGQDSSTASSNAGDSAQVSAAVSQPTDTSSHAGVSDTSASAGVIDTVATTSDTAATEMAGANAPMPRDTSVALAQGDSAVQAQVDTSSQAEADTATIGDTAVILTQTDTTQQTEVAVGQEADTMAMANDSTTGQPAERVHPDTVSQKADELAKHEPARVRPPEDSAEVRGNVTTDRSEANADAAPVGAAGVASTGNIATGADAVALMTRQGESCLVPASDDNRDVLWDMASSPSSLNPCGTGTMTLPKIWTGEKK